MSAVSRKRSALDDISPDTRVKRSNVRSNRTKAATQANRFPGADENGQVSKLNHKQAVPMGRITRPTAAKAQLSPVEKSMDLEPPVYSFDSCPYAEEIYQTQIDNENKFFHRIGSGIKWQGRSISCLMRTILVNWLIEVVEEYKLRKETLYIAINYVDRFLLGHDQVERNFLQLIGIAAILIASKYEEIDVPRIDELVYITDSTYTAKQILETEKIILDDLDYDLTVSTIISFLPRFMEVARVCAPEQNYHAQFLADLTLTNYSLNAFFPPSLLAASIVCLTRHCFGETDLWGPEFLSHTRYSKSLIQECAREIWIYYKKALCGTKPFAVVEKYKHPIYCSVGSKHPPATCP